MPFTGCSNSETDLKFAGKVSWVVEWTFYVVREGDVRMG